MPDTLDYQPRQARGPGKWLTPAMHWIGRNFTRENLIQCLKTFASVGPLTLLIWIYAEREQIHPEPDIAIAIEVHCSDPRRIVTLQKPYPDKVVVADLAGPASTLDAVLARLQHRNGDEKAVDILIDPTLEPGKTDEIDTRQALAANELFRGVTISNCQPPKLEVYMDELVEKDVTVQAPANVTNLTGPPVFTPRTVRVKGPKASIEKLGNNLVAEADLTGLDAMNIPGAHDIPVVRINPLADPSLSFSPPVVEATVSVRESDVAGTIRSVPVWATGLPEVLARYRVDLGDHQVLTNVNVTGPKDKILLVNQPDFSPKPRAELEIHSDDEPGKPIERLLQFNLPPDMGLKVNQEAKIVFKLVPLDSHSGE